MWQQFWHDAVRSLETVHLGLATVYVVTAITRRRLSLEKGAGDRRSFRRRQEVRAGDT